MFFLTFSQPPSSSLFSASEFFFVLSLLVLSLRVLLCSQPPCSSSVQLSARADFVFGNCFFSTGELDFSDFRFQKNFVNFLWQNNVRSFKNLRTVMARPKNEGKKITSAPYTEENKEVYSPKVTKLTSPLHYLTPQQKLFVESIMQGKSPVVSARIAGYASPHQSGTQVLLSRKVRDAIAYLHKKHEKVADVSRKKVMDGFLEAIDMAKMQADSGNMIAGWREIGRMCGYYAPEVKKVDITVTAKRIVDKLETLSDSDLLQMVEDSRSIIEGEASLVLDELQTLSDSSV